MAICPIELFPSPMLRKKAQKVTKFGKSLEKLVRDMRQTMHKQPHGIGIAAPQIGVSKAVAIVDVSARIKTAHEMVLVNPQIMDLKQPKISREGCMSLPEYTSQIKRYDWIKFRWQDLQGLWHEKSTSGIEAVCVQHEVDHLLGKLFLDHVVSLKRDLIPRPKK